MRTCNRCKIQKPFIEFNKELKSNTGFSTICKLCKNEGSRKLYQKNRIKRLQQIGEYRANNPHVHRKQSAEYYENNKDEIVIKRATNRIKNPDMYRNQWLRQKYGITVEEYNAMFLSQNGECIICGTHASELKKGLCVDHCHNSGKVRGLLCSNCNTGIGHFKENIFFMQKATEYLLKYV